MKKNLFFHFSVLAMLIVLISACSSKKSEYTNVIPSDASQVIAVNLKSLADKAGTKDKETKEALQKLTDALKSDMNAATFQQMEAVLKDPAKSGVDVHAPIYIFNAPSFPYTTMVAKVQNEDDLLKLLEVTEKEQISSHVAEADGYSFVQINKQALLAFTPTTLMVVNYTGTSQLEKVKEGIPALLKQTEENSINSNTAFKKMQKQNGDIMYDFQSERLNFDFESLKPKETWDKKLRRLMRYFEEDAQLRDILITGGDALMSQNATLRNILDAVYKMAVRKRKANESRPEGEKYAELQRVRLGSRLLAYLPLRITDELVGILRSFKDKASRVGVTQFIIQTHFQSPLEVTPEAKKAIEAILSAGWIITNQLVYTVAASRRGHTAKLRQTLNAMGVVCYYTFSVKGFHENYAVFAPNSRSLQEQQEEKVFGLIPKEKQKELYRLIRYERPLGKKLSGFLKENRLLFAATDRSVLNLPAIGKSMTFQMVGLTTEGKRILKFDHDTGRRHSPIIDRMGEVYIVENKSVAAYLRQLQDMGEDVREYISIWNYSEGRTEPRFSIYEYPDYPFDVTEKMTNLEL